MGIPDCRDVRIAELEAEVERLREVLRCAWHLRDNESLRWSPDPEDEYRYQAVWDALNAAINAAKE